MPQNRINAKMCVLFSADCMSHMISGSITLTNINLCYDICVTTPDDFKAKFDLPNVISFRVLHFEIIRGMYSVVISAKHC